LNEEDFYLKGRSGDVSSSVFNLFTRQLNDRDVFGRTALFYAALYKPTYFTEKLLEAGADPSIADNDGVLPEHIAAARRMPSTARFLAARRRQWKGIYVYDRNMKCVGGSESVVSLHIEEQESTEESDISNLWLHVIKGWCTDEDYSRCALQTYIKFVEHVLKRVAQIDQRFTCSMSLVGSTYEQTRIDYPEELDCLLVLTSFEPIVRARVHADLPHCVTFRRKLGEDITGYESFFSSNGILLTQVIKDKLYSLVIEATSSVDVW